MRYNDLKSMEKALTQQILSDTGKNDKLQKIIAKTVSNKAQTEVYDKFTPYYYQRRGIKGGLADPDNVERTSIGSSGNQIKLVYENTTEGVDTLQEQSLTDVIEEGRKEAWSNPEGVWSLPRPFIEPAIQELKDSDVLRNELVSILRESGLDVK